MEDIWRPIPSACRVTLLSLRVLFQDASKIADQGDSLSVLIPSIIVHRRYRSETGIMESSMYRGRVLGISM